MSEKPSSDSHRKPIVGHAVSPRRAENRRSRWEATLAAIRYIDASQSEGKVKLRDSDRATAIALLIVCIASFLSLVLSGLAPHKLPLVLSADVLVGVVLVLFMGNRVGVMTSLTPRQAVLSYQLMVGAGLIGIFLALNMVILSACILSDKRVYVLPKTPTAPAQFNR